MTVTLRSRRTVGWMIVMTLVACVLAFIPLFDVLGFEMSFVIGIFASFAAGDLGAAAVRRGPPGESVLRLFITATARNLALLLPPLVVITANGLRVQPCDPLMGLAFYVLLPGLSVTLATATGVVLAVILQRWPRLAAVGPWLFILGSIALGVVRFYTAPPIFGYDPYAGWFPGALYDEDLVIGGAFIWSRVYQLTLMVAGLAFASAVQRPRVTAAVLAIAAAITGGFLLQRSADLGFTARSQDIAAALGGRYETEHFIIVYPKGASYTPIIPLIALDHEYRWRQVTATFGVAPAQKITSFYFTSPEEKERWMGAEATYIAKPWRNEIYLSHEGFPHGSLRHEIAHVIAGLFGDPLFHISVSWWGWPPLRFNVGLIEGAAVAADWPPNGRLTPHESVRAMIELGYLPPLRSILATGFLAFSSAQSYTTAGSFSRYLLDTYGADKYRALYRSGGRPASFDEIYGKSLDDLEAAWRAFIMTVPLPPEEKEISRERFRRRGIFFRPCPHAIARLARRAHELIEAGRADEAIPLVQSICRQDPGEPGHRMELADTQVRAGHDADAEALYHSVADDEEVTTPLRAQALMGLIDLLGRAGRTAEAAAALIRAEALAVDENTRRNLNIRRSALTDAGLAGYVFARGPLRDAPDPVVLYARAAAVAGPVGAYLRGRVLYGRDAYADAAAELTQAAEGGLTDPLIARENDRILVVSAYLAGDLETARAAAIRMTAEGQPSQRRRQGADWLGRIEFAGRNHRSR